MKISMTTEIHDCKISCPHHRTNTGTKAGTYCSLAKSTVEGDQYRFVHDEPIAPVPNWCPLIIKQYKNLMLRGNIALNCKKTKSVISWAHTILKELGTKKFSVFRYEMTERDECLISLAGIRAYNREHGLETYENCLDNKEDRDIVMAAAE